MIDDSDARRNPPFKKYIVFSCPQYYPSGGLSDIEDSFDDIEEARAFVKRDRDAYIVDRDTWETVP